MKTRVTLSALLIMAVSFTATLTASTAIPHLMNYQGKATDKAGAPLNGAYNLTFRIYNAEAGGASKWSETQPNISISNGIFQVQLGSLTPLTLSFDEPYWISIEINTDGEMAPRTKLAAVPYAYRAESLADTPVIPFYKKGFDIRYVDFNSVKIAPGVMDVAGKMFTTSTYSNPLQLAYLDDPANRDWVHGQKSNSSTACVYAYNDNGQVAFKFSDELPNLSDHYGNMAGRPLLYRRYPDTTEGAHYRYIGKVKINGAGVISAITDQDKASPTSIFSVFGGNGLGDVNISSDTNFSAIDGADTPGILQCDSLTIDAGKTLTIDTRFAYIGVSGDCVIHGTISAAGNMGNGGNVSTAPRDGKCETGNAVFQAGLGGGGGGGGGGYGAGLYAGAVSGGSGGAVGGKNGNGGNGGTASWNSTTNSILLSTAITSAIFSGGGGGGGVGYAGATGGAGGGIIYIEVSGKLIFDGTLTANGANGTNNYEGGGGGGGGGVIIVRAKTIANNIGIVKVAGGAGGTGYSTWPGSGGSGGAGYSAIVEI